MKCSKCGGASPRAKLIVVALTSIFSVGGAHAFEVETGNADLTGRWDNTFKYSAAARLKDPSPGLTQNLAGKNNNTLNSNDGDQNFHKGIISNRVDWLSELDINYKKDFGLRMSGAAWYDQVYNRSNDNNAPGTVNSVSVSSNQFTDATAKLHGRKAELLDAFVYLNGDIGSSRASIKVGKHTLLWGEALFFGGNSIGAGMAPVDAIKGASVPGSQAKELLMPVGQVSGQLQLSETLSLAAFYQYDWKRTRLPAAGSYFSTADVLDAGGERLRAGPGATAVPGTGLFRGSDINAKDSGQGGLALKTRFGETDMGVYAIRYHAKTPVLYLTPGLNTDPAIGKIGEYRLVYPENIKAFGISANRSIGDIGLGGEISIRRNTPLTSNPVTAAIGSGADNNGNPLYAVGNSAHAQVSAVVAMPRSFIADSATLMGEIAWNRMTSCVKNCTPAASNGQTSTGARDPNATRDSWGFRVAYQPNYFDVIDGLNVTPSVSASYFPKGKSSVQILGPNHGGDITLGASATYLAVWIFGVNYTHFYGPENTPTFLSTGKNTYAQALKDRDFISLSVSRTF